MRNRRLWMGITAMALTAAVSVGGTLAYLSAVSQEVTNTFALGTGYIEEVPDDPDDTPNTGIRLDEQAYESDGETIIEDARTQTGVDYKGLLPGDSRVKDPTVYMIGGSVESYVFVRVDGVQELEDEGLHVTGWNTNDWTMVVPDEDSSYDGIYVYQNGAIVDYSDLEEGEEGYAKPQKLSAVFTGIELDGDIEDLEEVNLDAKEITVKAAAVQAAENMTGYQDALKTLEDAWE